MNNTLLRSWFLLARSAGLGRIFSFICNLLISRFLGPLELGVFNLAATTVQTGDTLVRCGSDYSLNYYLGSKGSLIHTHRGRLISAASVQICTLATLILCTLLVSYLAFSEHLLTTLIGHSQKSLYVTIILSMVFLECITSSAWEILLVSRKLGIFAMRQGLYIPMRLFLASIGALFFGLEGALSGWSLTALIQALLLKRYLSSLWRPLRITTILFKKCLLLLKRGLGFYCSNLLSALVFYPLLLGVASTSGLADVGYLRVGQILQQLFVFIPLTLAPVLFLKLRSEGSFQSKVSSLELPFRLLWLVLLQAFLLYCLFDNLIISLFFGSQFSSAIVPSRLLVLTSLVDSLAQVCIQPILASAKIKYYVLIQNGSAMLAAFLGYLWIPNTGLAAYLIVRLIYSVLPIAGLFQIYRPYLTHSGKSIMPLVITLFWAILLSFGITGIFELKIVWPYLIISMVLLWSFNSADLFQLFKSLNKSEA